MTQPSRTEKFRYYNSLVCVVKGLEGQYTTIDLQNEACVTGKIKHVDGFMNVDMEDAVFYDPRGAQHAFESFFVRGRLIRYVHIPKDQPAIEIINNQLKNYSYKPQTTITTLKTSRAKRYQQEILEQLFGEGPSKSSASGT